MNEEEMKQVLDEARPVKHRIALLLQDGKVGYTIALVAMTQVMMDIVVLGFGKTEPEARAFLTSLFIPEENEH
jgi:hypothetical protein